MNTILLINPNTSARTLAMMLEAATPHLPAGVSIRGVRAAAGPTMIVDTEGLRASAAEVTRLGRESRDTVSAIVVAAFGDPGVEELRRTAPMPIVGIGEASMREASVGGRRFGIATTTPALVESITDLVGRLGLAGCFTGVRLPPGDPLTLAQVPEEQEEALREATRRCIETDGAEAVVIGGGPLSATAQALWDQFPGRIIEPVPAAMRWVAARL